jgi:DNA-binding GntR family transcriptional regulator
MTSIQSASLVETAAAYLRNAILVGDLAPGAEVRVRELQVSLGVSHIPIREAIRRLEAEGLIIVRAHRTPVVAGVNLADLAAIYELRRMIELPTVELARERATAHDVRRAQEAFHAYEEVAGDPSSPLYWARHSDFHWSLIVAGANSWTRQVLDPLWIAAERYVRLFVSSYATPEVTLGLHRALLEAFMDADARVVSKELEHHFATTERGVREGFSAVAEP